MCEKYSSLERFCLKNKIIIVTGGTGILGKLYCERLAQAGATVIISDLDDKKCDELAELITTKTNVKAYGRKVDLSQEQSVIEWAAGLINEFGAIDVLINNAATKSKNFFAPLESFPLDDWNKIISVNVTGIFLASREIGRNMSKTRKGNIINISSIYGIVGPDQRIYEGSWYEEMGGEINTPLIYSATKGAVVAMTKYMATYWGNQGIRTNTLTPGGVSSGQNEIFDSKYSNKVPLGRMANADEMVGALIFLASDASSYVNGQNIVVDGGWTAW